MKVPGPLSVAGRLSLLRPSVALLTLLILHMTQFWCTYAWLPLYLREKGMSITEVGWFQIGINAGHVAGDVAFGFLSDRFGRKRTFVVFCLACTNHHRLRDTPLPIVPAKESVMDESTGLVEYVQCPIQTA